MEVKIQIADSVYTELLNGTCRVRGTIGLVSPKKGNFNAHRKPSAKPSGRYMKLPHGRVTVNNTDVYLSMKVGLSEMQSPSYVIEEESRLASGFVEFVEEINEY